MERLCSLGPGTHEPGWRKWEILSVYAQKAPKPPETVKVSESVAGPDQFLEYDEELVDGDMVSICGTMEGSEGTSEYRLYRIYMVAGRELGKGMLRLTSDNAGGRPSRLGGPTPKANGRWAFDAWTGVLTAYDTERQISTKYKIGPDCLLYLEAIAKNWTWEDHFDVVVDIVDSDNIFALPDQPEAAAKLVGIFSAFIRQREQAAKDAEGLVKALGAIRVIGEHLLTQIQQTNDPCHDIEVLVRDIDRKTRRCAVGAARELIAHVLGLCGSIDPEIRRRYDEMENRGVKVLVSVDF